MARPGEGPGHALLACRSTSTPAGGELDVGSEGTAVLADEVRALVSLSAWRSSGQEERRVVGDGNVTTDLDAGADRRAGERRVVPERHRSVRRRCWR